MTNIHSILNDFADAQLKTAADHRRIETRREHYLKEIDRNLTEGEMQDVLLRHCGREKLRMIEAELEVDNV